tara:strand:+ start:379 stop:618 length:240 start_codon:yes stop_codon:yes gene_type:complete
MPKVVYTVDEKQNLINRANDFMKKNPEASRARVARYAGCAISILQKWEKLGLLKLPPVMTKKQVRKQYNWSNHLGKLNG